MFPIPTTDSPISAACPTIPRSLDTIPQGGQLAPWWQVEGKLTAFGQEWTCISVTAKGRGAPHPHNSGLCVFRDTVFSRGDPAEVPQNYPWHVRLPEGKRRSPCVSWGHSACSAEGERAAGNSRRDKHVWAAGDPLGQLLVLSAFSGHDECLTLAFVKWRPGAGWRRAAPQQTTREIREFITHRARSWCTACPGGWGHTERTRRGTGREAGPKDLVPAAGILPRGCVGHLLIVAGRQGRRFIMSLLGKSHQYHTLRNLHLLVALQDTMQGMCLPDRASDSLRSLQPSWPEKKKRRKEG